MLIKYPVEITVTNDGYQLVVLDVPEIKASHPSNVVQLKTTAQIALAKRLNQLKEPPKPHRHAIKAFDANHFQSYLGVHVDRNHQFY